MTHRILLTCIVISTCSIWGFSQENDSLSLDDYYRNLFDTTLTESEFLVNINGFVSSIGYPIKEAEKWHSGQSDYYKTCYRDSIQTVNSIRHFNSFRYPEYLGQLIYKGKVIQKITSGGEPISDAIYFQSDPEPVKSRRRKKRKSKQESTELVEEEEKELVVDELINNTITETYFNHELGRAVVFTAEVEVSDPTLLIISGRIENEYPHFNRRYSRIISVHYRDFVSQNRTDFYIEKP